MMNDELNKIIHWLAATETELWQVVDVNSKCDGMAAISFYDGDQTKHIDASDLMTFYQSAPGNSALWMRNAAVNSPQIIFNSSSKNSKSYQFKALHPINYNPKCLCFDLDVNICKGGHSVAIPPDVATIPHQTHLVNETTIILTIRCIDTQIK